MIALFSLVVTSKLSRSWFPGRMMTGIEAKFKERVDISSERTWTGREPVRECHKSPRKRTPQEGVERASSEIDFNRVKVLEREEACRCKSLKVSQEVQARWWGWESGDRRSRLVMGRMGMVVVVVVVVVAVVVVVVADFIVSESLIFLGESNGLGVRKKPFVSNANKGMMITKTSECIAIIFLNWCLSMMTRSTIKEHLGDHER